MQEIKIYVSASNALGVIRDYANAKNVSAPVLVRGCEVMLKLRLFADSYGETPYPIEQLQNVTSWQFVMDKDFDSETAFMLQGDNQHIEVQKINETVNELEREFTEVSIPLVNSNTQELADWLGKEKSKSGLYAELVGYDATGNEVFVLQLENFTFRNRLTSQDDPTEIDPEYMTAAQINAIVTDLQRQINSISGGGGTGGSTNAADIIISAESQYYAGMDVASALQIIGAELDGLEAELEAI
jgi:hypothetical protein